MDAMLRFGDRTSFLFKKPAQQSTDGTSAVSDANPLNEQLSTIAHVDTRSFAALFDRYQSLEPGQTANLESFNHASPSAKDFAWPVASPLHSSSAMLNSQSHLRALPSTQVSSSAKGSGGCWKE